MWSEPAVSVDRRQFARFACPPMYTPVRARAGRGMSIVVQEGHVYDISEGGVRLELDEPLDIGAAVDLEIELPGGLGTVNVTGRIVRVFDAADDPGPRRMAVQFERFRSSQEKTRLASAFGSGLLPRAA